MITAFEHMPADAKIWIYGANKKLNPAEQADITAKASAFVENWTAHQKQLKAAFAILHDVFLVISVDPSYNEVSGCGIDKLVHFIQDIDQQYNLNLFNRLQIELLVNNEILLTNKQKLAVMLQDGAVNEQTNTFNKTITDKENFDRQFLVPLSQSWVYPSIVSLPNV